MKKYKVLKSYDDVVFEKSLNEYAEKGYSLKDSFAFTKDEWGTLTYLAVMETEA